jgi:hypothetical protein
MEQNTLAEILGVEKEIRDKLDAERDQASQWLANARREIEQVRLAETARLEESGGKDEQGAQTAAGDKAAEIVRQAQSAVQEIDRYADDDLRRLIRRHIAVIAPGASRDH